MMENEKRLIDAMQTGTKLSGRITPLIQAGANPMRVYQEVLQVIAEAPTVDATVVVRCKDCKCWEELNGKDSGKPVGYGYCRNPIGINGIAYEDSFCSNRERRDNV